MKGRGILRRGDPVRNGGGSAISLAIFLPGVLPSVTTVTFNFSLVSVPISIEFRYTVSLYSFSETGCILPVSIIQLLVPVTGYILPVYIMQVLLFVSV